MRYRERNSFDDLPFAGNPTKVMVGHESVRDVNNRRARPNSDCKHFKARYSPKIVYDAYGADAALYTSASSYALYAESKTAELCLEHYDRCVRKMQRLIDKQVRSFSTLNFLYELRELPDLFKKIRRPEDLRFIDWQFGVYPMLADLKNALTAYNSQVSSFNEKMRQYRSIECNWTKTGLVTIDRDRVTFGLGNAHQQTSTFRVTTRMRGTIEMTIPWLAQVSPELFSILDDIMVDFSASNAWEALPWSWFYDYFLPIGQYLEALPSFMKPLAWFNGTISHRIVGFGNLETLYEGPAWFYPAGQEAGKYTVDLYDRKAFSSSVSSLVRWKLDSINKPSQIALLRDIFYSAPNKRIRKAADDYRKGNSAANGDAKNARKYRPKSA